MRFCVLGSGSKGNCILIASGRTILLIDAGFSGIEIKKRLLLVGYRPEDITAVLITHEHADHVSGAGIMSRRYSLPVYANPATHRAAESMVGRLHAGLEFGTGESFTIDDLQIHPFAISHDTADPVGFIVSDGNATIGCCTDTGRVTKLIRHHLSRCNGLILEANHDVKMLQEGPYPMMLKQRVRSSQGHLANEDAGDLLFALTEGSRLRQVVLAHLSETNNLPHLALAAVNNSLSRVDNAPSIQVAYQHKPTVVLDLD